MKIRHIQQADFESVMRIINQAKAYFRQAGINQWQNGYPNTDTLRSDCDAGKGYVLCNDDGIIGYMYYAIEEDPTYLVIEDGDWPTEPPYAVIHRVVVDANVKGRGLAAKMVQYVADDLKHHPEIRSIRMDTHEDNQSMQRFLTKNGFVHCGTIHLADGAPRMAFEKRLA